ncbi:MAG: mechanosensitive ion channel family protein [Opitutales bacterium]
MDPVELDFLDWLTIGLTTLAGFFLGWLVQAQLRRGALESRRQGDLLQTLSQLVLAKPARWLGVAAGFRVGVLFIPEAEGWSALLRLASEIALLTAVGKVGWDFAAVLGHLVRRSARRPQEPFIRLLVNGLRILIVILLSAQALSIFGGALFSTILLGLSLLAIGLAMICKELLSDLIGTFQLIMSRPFAPGDHIEVGGVRGQVEQFRTLSTRLRGPHGEALHLPNGFLARQVLSNCERQPFLRCQLTATLEGDPETERVLDAVRQSRELFSGHLGQLSTLPPQVRFVGVQGGAVQLEAVYFVQPGAESLAARETERLSIAWAHLLAQKQWKVRQLSRTQRPGPSSNGGSRDHG